MGTVTLALALRAGKDEAWRRFCQALQGSRWSEQDAACRRLTLRRAQVWLSQTPRGQMVILTLDAADTLRLPATLAAASSPFERWLRAQLLDMLELDLTRPRIEALSELLLEWPTPDTQENDTMSTMTENGASSPTEANKAVVRRFFEQAWNASGFPLLDELLVADYQHHDPSLPPAWQRGREAYKQLTGAFFAGFPDLRVQVADLVADGDMVAARWTWEGTQDGAFQGLPPTGRHVQGSGMSFHRVAAGQIAEAWFTFDALGMMQQLGAIPGPGADR